MAVKTAWCSKLKTIKKLVSLQKAVCCISIIIGACGMAEGRLVGGLKKIALDSVREEWGEE